MTPWNSKKCEIGDYFINSLEHADLKKGNLFVLFIIYNFFIVIFRT